MGGSKNPSRKQALPASGSGAASRSSEAVAGNNVADSDPRNTQQQDVNGSKGPGNEAEAVGLDCSHAPPSMQCSTAKGPHAQAIDDNPGAVVARESQLMLLSLEITDLKALQKAKKPNMLAVLEQRQKDLTGLPLHAVRLHILRVAITAALNGPGGDIKISQLHHLYTQLLMLARGPSQGHDLRSSTAYALIAYCLAEIVKEGEEHCEACGSSMQELVFEVKHLMGYDEVSGSLQHASDWLDPKLEAVIEGKGAAKVDKVEGEDLSARLRSRLAYMEAGLKQIELQAAQQLQEENHMRQEHMKQVGGVKVRKSQTPGELSVLGFSTCCTRKGVSYMHQRNATLLWHLCTMSSL